MLRNLYLLSLLLCIEVSFCYNYIDEQDINSLRHNVREKGRRPKPARKSRVYQEDDYDRSPVQFDVASFIQPEEDMDTNEMVVKRRSSRRGYSQKPYDFGSIMQNEDSNKMDKTPDYINDAGLNPPVLPKELINSKHFSFNPLDDYNRGKYGHDKFRNIYKDDLLVNHNVHGHEKKCSLKNMKFPFFSHNKSEPMKPKKNNKKRFFFFTNNNKNDVAEIPDFNKVNEDPYKISSYKKKRSYEQRLCPACKKLFTANLNQNRYKKNPKLIHNSRQFFQNLITDATLKDVAKEDKVRRSRKAEEDYLGKNSVRDRQMKELEEVQRKIDNLEIRLPHFESPSATEKLFLTLTNPGPFKKKRTTDE